MSGPSDRGPTSHETSSHLPGATTDDAERFESGIRNVEFGIHEICRSVQIHISNFQRSVSSAVKASLLGAPARRATRGAAADFHHGRPGVASALWDSCGRDRASY